jgi:hypothetical protein
VSTRVESIQLVHVVREKGAVVVSKMLTEGKRILGLPVRDYLVFWRLTSADIVALTHQAPVKGGP